MKSFPNSPANIAFIVSPEKSITVRIDCDVFWKSGVYERSALMKIGATFLPTSSTAQHAAPQMKECLEMSIGAAEDETVISIANDVAKLLGLALSRIEAAGGASSTLPGTSV